MVDASEGSSKEEEAGHVPHVEVESGRNCGEAWTKTRSSPFTSVWHISGETGAAAAHCREGSLHKLIATNNISGVRLWLSNPFCRSMINDLNHAGETPLHVAVQCCSPRILSLLLDPPPLQISPSLLASCSLRLPRPLAGTAEPPSGAPASSNEGAPLGGSAEEVADAGVASLKTQQPFSAETAISSVVATDAAAACDQLAMAAAARVDFSLSVDGIPTLHLLIGRTAFGGARGEDAMECLKRILLHIGRFQPGAADRCPRCSPGKTKPTACGRERSGVKAESVAFECGDHVSDPQAGGLRESQISHPGLGGQQEYGCQCCGGTLGSLDSRRKKEMREARDRVCCPEVFTVERQTSAADSVLLDLEEMDLQGRTALHLACSFGVSPVAELLLHAGASPWARRLGLGQLPIHSAIDADDPACCLLLLRHTLPCRFFVNFSCICGRRCDSGATGGRQAPVNTLALKRSPAATKFVFQLVRRCVRRGAWRCFRALLLYPTESSACFSGSVEGGDKAEGLQPGGSNSAASPRCEVENLGRKEDACERQGGRVRCVTKDVAASWCSGLHGLLDGEVRAWLYLREEARRAGALLDLKEQLQRVVTTSPACCQAAAASWTAVPASPCDGHKFGVKSESETGLLLSLFGTRGDAEGKAAKRGEGRTMVVTHALCLEHLPLPEPADMPLKRHKLMQRFPENPSRLEVVTSDRCGILRTREFSPLLWMDDPMPASLSDILRVHSMSYIARLKLRVEDAFGISTRLPSLSPPLSYAPGQTAAAATATGAEALAAAAAALDSKLQKEQYEKQKRQQIENVGSAGRYSFVFADGDTPVTCFSWAAAVHAAGAVIAAVDAVCERKCRNAFCAVRPPGHHLGNWGAAQTASNQLTDEDIAAGSQGFCLLNNVAIGAAYAKYNYSRKGIRRIAIVDFDVHHGNGTEQIIRNVGMKIRKVKQPQGAALRLYRRAADELRGTSTLVSSNLSRDAPAAGDNSAHCGPDPCEVDATGSEKTPSQGYHVGDGGKVSAALPPQLAGPVDVPQWMGWRDERDAEELFFASIHAFDGTFYPGTGADCEDFSGPVVINVNILPHPTGPSLHKCCRCQKCSGRPCAGGAHRRCPRGRDAGVSYANASPMEVEMAARTPDVPVQVSWSCHFCRHPTLAPSSVAARRLFLKRIIRPLLRFGPDLLFISAGFDGHAQDQIGGAFGGFAEEDFRFFTHALVRCAERTCEGRVVSVLEGGYSVSGGVSSTLAASVKEHLRGLMRTPAGGSCFAGALGSEEPSNEAHEAAPRESSLSFPGKNGWEEDIEVGDAATSDVTASDVEESWQLIEGENTGMDGADSSDALLDEGSRRNGSDDGPSADALSHRRPREAKTLDGCASPGPHASTETASEASGHCEREHSADFPPGADACRSRGTEHRSPTNAFASSASAPSAQRYGNSATVNNNDLLTLRALCRGTDGCLR
ncbi:histone deacetylase HDAC5 [Toxoplasma gondii MAS]|uniref:Histone deacetylase HDAC5 n=1 Tax=Toxoplasma gondii MAS TaxID=943118 RepID=A0A086QGI1_TOXGO|nr:histone deacetylase HDAC5 [Toxoplasma gondii MAS]